MSTSNPNPTADLTNALIIDAPTLAEATRAMTEYADLGYDVWFDLLPHSGTAWPHRSAVATRPPTVQWGNN